MLSEKLFKYYTNTNFTVESSYWGEIKGKFDEIETMAEETVKNRSKILDKDKFSSNAEYQVYLMCVCNFAWAEKLGTEVDSSVTE